MLPLKEKERDLEKHKFQGLVEHSHNVLRCSACGEDLLDVLVTDPDLAYKDGSPVEWDYRADCPICGDHSFPARIRGRVGIVTLEARRVLYETAEPQGNVIYLRTSKGKV
jgi:uncharacterized protein (UPF0212 family)